MLPPELILRLCDDINVYSLVSLSKVNRAWRSSIPDEAFRIVLIRHVPFYELANSPRSSWAECSRAHVARMTSTLFKDKKATFKSILDSSRSHVYPVGIETKWPVYKNVSIPPGFYSLMTNRVAKLGPENCKVRYKNHGVFVFGKLLDLSERAGKSPTNRDADPEVDTFKILSNNEGIQLRISSDGNTAYSSKVIVHIDAENQVLVKYDTPGTEPDVTIALPHHEFNDVRPFVQGSHICLAFVTEVPSRKQLIHLYEVHGNQLKSVKHLWQNAGYYNHGPIWYDGVIISSQQLFWASITGKFLEYTCFDVLDNKNAKSIAGKSTDYYHSGEAIEDMVQHEVYQRYVIIYKTDGHVSGVWDLKTSRYMNLGSLKSTLTVVGLLDGELTIWTYTSNHLQKLMYSQHKRSMGFGKLQAKETDTISIIIVLVALSAWVAVVAYQEYQRRMKPKSFLEKLFGY